MIEEEEQKEEIAMVNSWENEMGDESSSNYTFGDGPLNNVMRVELIGEDHEDIPSDSSDS